jgi:phosphatidylglycerophosphate synthase
MHRPSAALALYLLAASTDLVDGWLARRSGRASAFGAQLDAAVDNLFSIAILAFLLLAYPGLLARHPIALTGLFAGPLAYLAVSWLLTRRLLMFHFWSAKAGAVLLFALWPALALTRWEGCIVVTALVVVGSRLEQVAFILRGGRALDAAHGLAPVPPPLPFAERILG